MAAAGALASRASDSELTLEQVAAMLSGVIGKPSQGSRRWSGRHAARRCGDGHVEGRTVPLPPGKRDQGRVQATQAASKALAGATEAPSAGTEAMDQLNDVDMATEGFRSPWWGSQGQLPLALILWKKPKNIEMGEPAESQKSWNLAETDAASSSGTSLTAQDYK